MSAYLFADEKEWVCPLDRKQMIKTMNDNHQKRMDALTQALNLTADQKASISKIIVDSRDKIAAERDKLIDMIVDTENNSDRDIKKQLTSEQLDKYDQIQSEHHVSLGERMKKWFSEGMCF
jgi:hypothetical protein